MIDALPPSPTEWPARRVIMATLAVLAVALAFWLLYRFYIVVFILFVAVVLATAIRPLVDWLAARGLPRQAGIILVYAALLAVTVGIALLMAPMLTEQVTTIVARLPDYYRSLREQLVLSRSLFIYRIGAEMPADLVLNLGGSGNSGSLNEVGQALNYLVSAGRGLFILVSVLVLAFFWTLDGTRAIRSLVVRFPADRRDLVRDLIEQMDSRVGAYMRGVVILSLSVAVMATIAYFAIGLPYALVMGIIAGLLETVPVIGPILGAAPPILLALSMDPSKTLWVILAVMLIQQIEANLLVPRVMDRAVGVNAIVTILSITAFGALFGLAGALMAIPLAAIIQVALDRLVIGTAALELEGPTGRDRTSTLRYAAQELAQDVRKQLRRKEAAVTSTGVNDRVEDMIESIATDLDSLLAQAEDVEERS